ncbi:MAG: CoA transferase [Geminicoccaceae bacterium]|nr:CoA transferase [Geminicoccaceae bacterium]MCX8100905.1 CoA transferase [Geminicoccaceae bacterium]
MSLLEGVRVVDLTHVMAGPTCTQLLADLGAEVIKVERIPDGDDTRRTIPPVLRGPDGSELSAAFSMMNRGKRGLALDLKSAGGRRVMERLLDRADVLVENYRKETLDRLGFGWERVRTRWPRIVYASISGFGRTGPYAEKGGFDLVAQAMSGILSITGTSRAEPPVKCGPPLTDIGAGMLLAVGILAALLERERTGVGRLVETSLFEAGIVFTYWQSAIALATGKAPGPLGSAHPLSAPYEAFPTADGRWIVVGGANQANWRRLCGILGAAALADDPRFATNADRMRNLAELRAILADLFRRRPAADWLARLDEAGVPAGPVNDILEMLADPQTRARNMVVELEHASLGRVATLGCPIKVEGVSTGPRKGPPFLGEDTVAILEECGFSTEEIAALREEGAIATADRPRSAEPP